MTSVVYTLSPRKVGPSSLSPLAQLGIQKPGLFSFYLEGPEDKHQQDLGREEGGPSWDRGGPTPTGPAQPHRKFSHSKGWVG